MKTSFPGRIFSLLLYPLNDEMRNHNDEISFDSGVGTQVHVHFVDLAKEDCLDELKAKLEKSP